MEYLRKLERVQRMLSFMEARGLSTSHQDSDRFLAHFLLFMVQPCDALNMQERFDLISQHLQKISATVLEESLSCADEEDQICAELSSGIYTENKSNVLSEAKSENLAKIGLDAMIQANSTLEDFCRSYFMFHGMDANKPQSLFRFLPVLYFTESYIYQLDTINEKELQLSLEEILHIHVEDGSIKDSFHETPTLDPLGPLISLLQCHGLLTERITTELKSGAEYWTLERKLCHALTRKKKILIEDVVRAIHLKSFDYRVLNLLLYQLRGQQVNDLHMEFLSISEFLVEVSDDLFDYEDDILENSFNILRMFVAIYGASEAPNMLAKCITEAEEKFEHLSKALDPELSLNYWRRCEEATKEGNTTSKHAFGTWSIPPIIVDENFFRLQSHS